MIRKLIVRFLVWAMKDYFAELEGRLHDLERHFVVKRDPDGKVSETLADIPFSKRRDVKSSGVRGASMHQRLAWLEKTEGGTRLPQPSRVNNGGR